MPMKKRIILLFTLSLFLFTALTVFATNTKSDATLTMNLRYGNGDTAVIPLVLKENSSDKQSSGVVGKTYVGFIPGSISQSSICKKGPDDTGFAEVTLTVNYTDDETEYPYKYKIKSVEGSYRIINDTVTDFSADLRIFSRGWLGDEGVLSAREKTIKSIPMEFEETVEVTDFMSQDLLFSQTMGAEISFEFTVNDQPIKGGFNVCI